MAMHDAIYHPPSAAPAIDLLERSSSTHVPDQTVEPAETTITRVLVVDDHPVVRGGIRFALLGYPDLRVVGEAGSGEEALSLVPVLRPHVVLMDMVMPGIGGLATIRTLRKLAPDVKILVLTCLEGGEPVRDALQAGALGFHLKGAPMDGLVQAIRLAAQNHPSLDPVAACRLAQTATRSPVLSENLTERERDVLSLLVQGLSNEQIAEKIVVTEATVKFHVRSIRRKLQANSRAHIVALALRHQLVPIEDQPSLQPV